MEKKIIDIPGFDGYKISNLGYVISYKGKTPKVLTISNYPNGYNFVSLSKDGKVKGYLLHRLVLMSFCPVDGMENLQVYVVLKSLVQELEEEAKMQGLVLTQVNVSSDEADTLNLLPDGQKRKLLPKPKLYKFGTICLLIFGTVLFTGAWCYKTMQVSKLREAQANLQAIHLWQKRYEKWEARTQKIKALSTAIAKLEKERVLWSELLPVLGASVPKDCWLTTIKQRDASQVVELQGKAKKIEQIKNLVDNLQVTKNFSKVTLLETNAIKGELIGYKIVLCGKGKGE